MPIPLSLHEVHHRGVDELFPWMYGGGDAVSRLWDRYLKEKNVGSIVDTCIGDSQTELFNIDISIVQDTAIATGHDRTFRVRNTYTIIRAPQY